MLSFALSLLVPPHARVNTLCYPVWNADRSGLEVMWSGARYSQPWTFTVEPDEKDNTCVVDECVQRLWCTDTGAAGRYAVDRAQQNPAAGVRLDYTWLRNTSARGSRVLSAAAVNGTPLALSSAQGHGTVVVAGDTLYYYTFADNILPNELPRLSALQFREYAAGLEPDQLVQLTLSAYDILGFQSAFSWRGGEWSTLYASDRHAVSVSVSGAEGASTFAVDAIVNFNSSWVIQRAFVHYDSSDAPSVRAVTREVLTTPSFTCRARLDETRCFLLYVTPGARFTWSTAQQTAFGQVFAPLSSLASFVLPDTLWYQTALSVSLEPYVPLAGFGQSAVMAVDGLDFYVFVARDDPSCSSGKRVYLVLYSVMGKTPQEKAVVGALHCVEPMELPTSTPHEVPYAAALAKWLGPFADTTTVLVADGVAEHKYTPRLVQGPCREGTFRDDFVCKPCPEGYFCPGPLDNTEEKRRCPSGSYTEGTGMTRCAVPSGYYFAYPCSVLLCEAGYYCPGALEERRSCPLDAP